MTKHLPKPIRAIHFMVLALLMTIGSTVAAKDEILVKKIGHSDYKTACVVLITGLIQPSSTAAFKEAVEELNSKDDSECVNSKLVLLSGSTGGDLRAAWSIMQIIRDTNLDTAVGLFPSTETNPTKIAGNFCYSSCALIFASGRNRHFLTTDTNSYILGIHKPSFAQKSENYLKEEKALDDIKYKLADFYKEIGISPKFVISMFQTEFADMKFEQMKNLLIWRVITSFDYPLLWQQLK